MTPIRLTMKNFITYLDETLDFEAARLSNQVFLITGDTGAGKTTIFDAVMFALYGETSGSSRMSGSADDNYAGLHCNYAEPTARTEVSFEFRVDGKRYRAYREFHYSRSGKLQNPTAQLSGDDIEVPIEGARAVNARCMELLGGLNAAQFKQVAMLAQGEFKKFMEAGSEEKQRILQMLFNMEGYTRYVNLLGEAERRMRSDRDRHIKEIEHAMKELGDASAVGPEVRDRLVASEPELPRYLTLLTECEENDYRAAEEEKAAAGEKHAQAIRAAQACRQNNEIVRESEDAQRKLAGLRARENDMKALEAEAARAEQVRGAVREPLQRKDEAIRQLEEARTLQAKRCEQEKQCAARLVEMTTALEAEKAREPELLRMTSEISALEKELPAYAKREEKRRALKQAEADRQRCTEALCELEKAIAARQARIGEIDAALEGLKDIDAVRAEADGAHRTAKEQLERMEALYRRVKDLRKEAATLRSAKEALERANGTLRERLTRAAEIELAFLSGQARVLARELGRRNETEDATCPVCGQLWRAGSFHVTADERAEVPTQDAVDAAKDAKDRAQKEYNAQAERVSGLSSAYEEKRKQLTSDAGELTGGEVQPEALDTDDFFRANGARLREAEQATASALAEAGRRAGERDGLARERKDTEKALNAALEREKATREALSRADSGISEAKGVLDTIRLSYETEAEAKHVLRTKLDGCEALRRGLESAEKAHADATKAHTEARTRLDESEKQVGERSEALEKAQSRLAEALACVGFEADVDGARTAMHEGDEGFVTRSHKEIAGYRSDLANAEQNATACARKAEGLSYADPAVFDRAVTEAKDRMHALEEQNKKLYARMENHRKILDAVCGARKALDRTERAYERLYKLKEMAEKGLSFERFALSEDFDEVLERANDRLCRLSNNRFTLKRNDKGSRANGAAGLDIEVEDSWNSRTVRCKDLSGGESFQVSMSLALGLSDVAQARAGGSCVNTIFIDEGFGTLDGEKLDNAVQVLNMLSSGKRTVGVISHVKGLEESIGNRVYVRCERGKGSRIQVL